MPRRATVVRPLTGVQPMTPDELRLARYRLKFSQATLAHYLGLSAATIAHWEQGRAPISNPTGLALMVLALQTIFGSGQTPEAPTSVVGPRIGRPPVVEDETSLRERYANASPEMQAVLRAMYPPGILDQSLSIQSPPAVP